MIKTFICLIIALTTIKFYGENIISPPQDKTLKIFSSNTQKKQYRQFIKNKNTNPDSAYSYAVTLLNDIDSTLIYNKEIAEVFRFASKYEGDSLFKYKNGVLYGEKAFNIYSKLGLEKEAARILTDVADYNFKLGNKHFSFNNVLTAMELAKKHQDTITIRECSLIMERIHYYYHNDEKTSRLYNKFVSMSNESEIEQTQRTKALNNLFYYPILKEEIDSIITVAEEIYEKYKINSHLVSIYLNAVLKYTDLSEMELAEKYLKKSLPLLRNIKDSGYYYSAEGYYNLMNNDFNKSIKSENLAKLYLNKGDFNPQMLLRSYDILQWIYMTRGEYENAYINLKNLTDIYINLVNEEKIIELSKSVNELQNKRTQEKNNSYKHTIRIVIIALILALLATITYFYASIQRRKLLRRNLQLEEEKHKNELKAKDDLIKVKRLQQYQESIFIQGLITQLKEISRSKEKENINTKIIDIIRQLEGRNDISNWIEVEKSLEGNNNTFLENLVKEHPDLTINERRLCTFIHLNMSTKEISNITNQTINGINAARTRLRKKFGLTGDDKSLITYLDKFDKI
ncbi:MAG: hypothetical protein J6U71_00035 [Bacteroidales bacterium]|nr:hypothetical protein [Bacteroidales bacterium]